MKTFDRESLPGDPLEWPEYRKKVTTHMVRIDGPFTVNTSEGQLSCDDGFLALDARGYPYPIAADEQTLIYEPNVEPTHGPPLTTRKMHPATANLLGWFDFAHLPTELAAISSLCSLLANEMANTLDDGPELSAGLRKLLEAKDCFVRANIETIRT